MKRIYTLREALEAAAAAGIPTRRMRDGHYLFRLPRGWVSVNKGRKDERVPAHLARALATPASPSSAPPR
jgi:hypothetical protein